MYTYSMQNLCILYIVYNSYIACIVRICLYFEVQKACCTEKEDVFCSADEKEDVFVACCMDYLFLM